jgi:DNA-binding NarL/FixJ family response regulator
MFFPANKALVKTQDKAVLDLPNRPSVVEKRYVGGEFPSGEDPTRYLSKTELQVLSCIGEGFNSGEIAEKLGLATGTVRNNVSAVMRKTGLQNRSQMARYAVLYGLARHAG